MAFEEARQAVAHAMSQRGEERIHAVLEAVLELIDEADREITDLRTRLAEMQDAAIRNMQSGG
jgi:hypothetical protein